MMTELILRAPMRIDVARWLFPGAIFVSAALVFLVQPMIAKMLLPMLGGSPAVWNASMAFFQTALLAGYGYAHLVQRIGDLRKQAVAHLCILAVASLALPLTVTGALGSPPSDAPVPCLLGVLVISVGAPFAALSATAPLLQSWFARLNPKGSANPYALYVASNTGSMLALLSYPLVVEPLLALKDQTVVWAGGYAVFALLIFGLSAVLFRSATDAGSGREAAPTNAGEAIDWKTRAIWICLAAAPSSLMLGTTTYLSTDVAAVPFMWVLPLALYLLTFIIAFQDRPWIPVRVGLAGQLVFLPLCLATLALPKAPWLIGMVIHLAGFLFAALVCHQALAARRPAPARLTEFYLCVSVGGVIGGATTAFLAPIVFKIVLEYPIVLLLTGLARPWGKVTMRNADLAVLATAVVAAGILLAVSGRGATTYLVGAVSLIALAAVAIRLKARRLILGASLLAVASQALLASHVNQGLHTVRTFFGVHRVQLASIPALGGPVHLLGHGAITHGAQPLSPAFRCTPTNYYAPNGAIGQVYAGLAASRPAANVGVVGLGSGSVVTYMRPSDRLRFFEIDAAVERLARDRKYFTYLSDCATGPTDVVLGDARLTLKREPQGAYDLIHLDAFTSDAIPTHLLTAEAIGEYLRTLKPDGLLLAHVSNNHMALEGVVAAAARRAGAQALIQYYVPPAGTPMWVEAPTLVMVISRSPQSLARFAADPRWKPARAGDARPWTDGYTNIMQPILAHMRMKPGADPYLRMQRP
jgi:spermidine synthase